MTRSTSSLMLAASLALSAPVGAETFRWAFQGDMQALDPYSLNETLTLGTLGNVYEGLVMRDKDLNIIPALATEWELVEPTVWRFKLREGVTFHNGNPFTADDVIFSLERTRKEGSDVPTKVASIQEINKIDDHTIEIVTKNPNPILTSDLSDWYIMDQEWAVEHGAEDPVDVRAGVENYATRHANGTGPFMVVEREPDVRTVLKPFDNWWGEPDHNITEAVFTPISSDATRVAALLSGELDMAYPIPLQDGRRLEATPGVSLLAGPEARTIFLGMDQLRDELLESSVAGKNPFQDVRVRRAFYQAIDVEAIKDKIMRGASLPTALMVAPQVNGFSEELNERYPYDPEAARALLTEAGYPEGFQVGMDCPNDRYVNDEAICQAVAAMLAQIGVDVELLAQTKSKYFAKILAFDTSFYMLGWTPSTFDAHNPLFNLINCRGEDDPDRGKFNLGGYCNERVDELTVQIQSEIDPEKRQVMIDEAFGLHKEEFGHIPLHQQPLSWGKKDSVELAQRADNVFDLRYVVVGE